MKAWIYIDVYCSINYCKSLHNRKFYLCVYKLLQLLAKEMFYELKMFITR